MSSDTWCALRRIADELMVLEVTRLVFVMLLLLLLLLLLSLFLSVVSSPVLVPFTTRS